MAVSRWQIGILTALLAWGMVVDASARPVIQGALGVDVDGYRDYRGVSVVGAWAWLDAYGFGVATELEVSVS